MNVKYLISDLVFLLTFSLSIIHYYWSLYYTETINYIHLLFNWVILMSITCIIGWLDVLGIEFVELLPLFSMMNWDRKELSASVTISLNRLNELELN